MKQKILEEELALFKNLHPICEKIRGQVISPITWHTWEKLAGSFHPQGKKYSDRKYTDEQTQMLMCIAWMYRNGLTNLTYKNVRSYWKANKHKFEEAYDSFIANPRPEPKTEPEIKIVKLRKVKLKVDEILGWTLSRESWSQWKQHIKIPLNAREVEEEKGWMLIYMAGWRLNNVNVQFPSIARLRFMMEQNIQPIQTIESYVSSSKIHEWEMRGCKGREIINYLAAYNLKVSQRSLYEWWEGKFSLSDHYSPHELQKWKQIVMRRRNKYAS